MRILSNLIRREAMSELRIGDRVLHPLYGVGTLVSIIERSRDGEAEDFYVVEMVSHKGRLETPVDRAEELGLRRVVSKRRRGKLSRVLGGRPRKLAPEYQRRRANISQRLREADFKEVGRVVRDLSWREATGQATTGDRRLLKRAKGLFARELAASDRVEEDVAMERIESVLEMRVSKWQERAQ
jgi:CarD family transcriptional regulator